MHLCHVLRHVQNPTDCQKRKISEQITLPAHDIVCCVCVQCRRCSVEGLSPIMFVLAIMGNATYGLGIFLYSVEPVFLLQRLPWLVGSVGTFVFDFIVSYSGSSARPPLKSIRVHFSKRVAVVCST